MAVAAGGALTLSALVALPALSGAAAGANIVANPGFEDGATGWSASGGTFALSDDAASGESSGSLSNRANFWEGLRGTLLEPLAHDGEYRVTAQVKHTEGNATEPFGFAFCPASGGCVAAPNAIKSLPKDGWQTYTVDFVPKESSYYTEASASVVFDHFQFETPWSSTVPFLIDDVTVERLDSPSGVLPDGAFEDGSFDGWYLVDDGRTGELALSAPGVDSEHALKVTGRGQTNTGPAADVEGKLEPGATYRLAADLKYTGGNATQQFAFTLCDDGFTYGVCQNAVTKTVNQGEWTDFSGEFVANPQAAPQWKNAFFETAWKETPEAADLVDFEIDNVSLIKVKDAPDDAVQTDVENIQTKPVGDHNPLMGHKFGADPHHVIFNDRLYIYSTSDDQQYRTAEKQENGLPVRDGGYDRINHLNVISTDDMVNWVDHGEVPVAGLDGVAKWAGNSWAPAAVSADFDGDGEEEVYLYFCNGGAGTGVIVGDSPVSGWEDPNGKMLISQGNPIQFPSGMWLFDPEIFVDDDDQPYLYFGGNWDFAKDPYHPKSTRVVKLDKNDPTKLADPTGAGIQVIDGPGMFEASSMFKHDGKYYYSYSSNFSLGNSQYADKKLAGQAYPGNGEIAYMMTDDPMNLTRDKFAGTAFASHGKWFPGSGGNNHSDMFEYQGKTYFTYHTQVAGLAWGKALNNGQVVNYRSVHLDELEFNDDGTIKEVVGTNAGVDQIKDFDPYRTFEAETLAWQLGVRTEGIDTPAVEFPKHNGDGNTVLTNIDDGDFTGISQADFADGAATVTARVKPLVAGGSIEVRLDSETGPVVSTIAVDTPVGEWGEVSAEVTGATGVHDLFFVFHGAEGERLLQVDNWSFEQGASTPATLEITTSTRCAAGKEVLVTTVTNLSDAPVVATVETPYGTKANVSLAVGEHSSQSFMTRKVSIAAGEVTATPAEGDAVTAQYEAASCG
ncbi:carbohydrate binding domain-containing protein [Agromyces larvae]|uniref:Carbohydrate binding domain-containing protein n=1 Tax=Agromyces larvae TaxID=2929802 RepID=A0ABY4BXV6_9MICO|nr:carbohydrate binding domain-containing protein [Agromyces larvae]UOE44017.1 carbohydrate binding domain-containing protein [Agromyces larvae]